MNRKSGSGSGIFLMEMIVAVFFFIICASTCILAFAKSDRMSRLATERNHAVSAAQTVAEIWKAEGAAGLTDRMDADKLTAEEPGSGGAIPEEAYAIYWDGSWQCVAGGQDCRYSAKLLENTAADGMKTLRILIREGNIQKAAHDGPALFELEVSRYAGGAGE